MSLDDTLIKAFHAHRAACPSCAESHKNPVPFRR